MTDTRNPATSTQLDEHTEADMIPPCEAPDCDNQAEVIVHLTHRLDGTVIQPPILACHDHTEALERHHDHCLFCSRWVRLDVEPINRRPA